MVTEVVPNRDFDRSEEFRQLLRSSGLSQKEFASLVGASKTAVNRWCSATANDRVPAPPMAVAFLLTFRRLGLQDRATVRRHIQDVLTQGDQEFGTDFDAIADTPSCDTAQAGPTAAQPPLPAEQQKQSERHLSTTGPLPRLVWADGALQTIIDEQPPSHPEWQEGRLQPRKSRLGLRAGSASSPEISGYRAASNPKLSQKKSLPKGHFGGRTLATWL